MLKTLLLVTLVVGAHGDLLSLIPSPSPVPAPSPAFTLSTLITAINRIVSSFRQKVSDGLVLAPPGFEEDINTPIINIPGNPTFTFGLIALPLPFLCEQTGIDSKLTCLIGALDCTYVHNKYSGACADSTKPVNGTTQTLGKVFVCNEQSPSDFNFKEVNDVKQCGPILGGELDIALNLAIKQILRARLSAGLCPVALPTSLSLPLQIEYDSAGCNSDCSNNHQYANGTCTTGNTATDTFPGEYNPGFQCICAL